MGEDHIEGLLTATRDSGSVEATALALRKTDDGYDLSVAGQSFRGLDEDRVRTQLEEHPAHVAEGYFWTQVAPDAPERRAFLRWVEGIDGEAIESVERHRERLRDGLTRAWGQLRVHVALTGDGRVYELRHVADAETDRETLDTHHDPLDARTLKKTDERGRYRPLSTAPTLRRGWVFEDLGPADVFRAVDAFYPATIANWHREREGRLDVTHWHEAVSRQTGIYGLVETWDRGDGHDHVERVAEACCADSQCLKRREWEYDADTHLDVDGSIPDDQQAGAGVFPCREPCSLVIAAARKWTRLEAEKSRTYEFELTPSEKEQLEEILDAVADGRAEDIREADFEDGANRYRARFLRAKHAEEGGLCGTPTDRQSDDGSPTDE